MDNTILIKEAGRKSDKTFSFTILLVVALLIGTFLRASLVVVYPFVALFIAAYYRFRISASFLLLTGMVAISLASSFFGEVFLRYKMLSLFYMIPFLLLLFSDPGKEKNVETSHLSTFIKSLTIVTLVNDLLGLVQLWLHPESDDSFIGIYSQFSISINGLMLVNTFLFAYYIIQFIYKRNYFCLTASIFFLICAMLGFYGAGLIICTIAFILAFLKSSEKAIVKTVLIGTASLLFIYFGLLLVKPLVLEYNLANIKKISSFDIENGPRKIKSFYNYGTSYPRDAKDFLLGSGPGTFNSRSAFMIGSPSYFTGLSMIKDDDQPFYFKNYAYTLWNENNTIQSLYLDGFRNQPFSSLLSFLGEYGLLFTLVFLVLYFYYFNYVSALYRIVGASRDAQASFRFFKFLMILLPLLLLIDNYYEYPEIMLLVLLGIKFSHSNLLKIKLHTPNALYQKTKL